MKVHQQPVAQLEESDLGIVGIKIFYDIGGENWGVCSKTEENLTQAAKKLICRIFPRAVPIGGIRAVFIRLETLFGNYVLGLDILELLLIVDDHSGPSFVNHRTENGVIMLWIVEDEAF